VQLRVYPTNYKEYLSRAVGRESRAYNYTSTVKAFFAAQKIFPLGSEPAKFSVHVGDDGKFCVKDDLQPDLALIHLPPSNPINGLEDEELSAFYWSVARLSRRIVINRPSLDHPFIDSVSDLFDMQNIHRESTELVGFFVYLNGRISVQFDGHQLPAEAETIIVRSILRRIGRVSYLMRGHWILKENGELDIFDLNPWCDLPFLCTLCFPEMQNSLDLATE
jgi:hypothetical protein